MELACTPTVFLWPHFCDAYFLAKERQYVLNMDQKCMPAVMGNCPWFFEVIINQDPGLFLRLKRWGRHKSGLLMEDEGAPVGSKVQIVTDNWGHGCTGTSSIPSCHICSLTAMGIISHDQM